MLVNAIILYSGARLKKHKKNECKGKASQSARAGDKDFNHIHRPPVSSQEIFLLLISIRGRVDPKAIV
jgi:hypothetical protein